MKARKVNLASYNVEVNTPEGKKSLPFDVRQSIVNVLLNPRRGLNGTGLLKADDVARFVRDEPTEEILLDKDDYTEISKAVEDFRGFGPNDVELVRRIKDAKEVDVEEAKN